MTTPYIFGTQSDQTRVLQQALAGIGVYHDAIDGIFGSNTRDAVAAARANFGLPSEGSVDTALLAKLGLTPAAPSNPIQSVIEGLLADGPAAIISQPKGLFSMSFLSGYKTYIVAALMLLTGLAGLLGVDIPNFTGEGSGNLVMEALAFFFLRQGLKTDATKS